MLSNRSFGALRQAIRYFLRQDLPDKELVIVAGVEDGIEERIPREDAIRFLRSPASMSPEEQWRAAIEACRGRYIASWDCGDWFRIDRLSTQIQQLRETKAALCVARELTYYSPIAARAWILTDELRSCLCRKTFLCDRHFPGLQPQAAAFAPDGWVVRNDAQLPITRVPAPWYIAISTETFPSPIILADPRCRAIAVGDIAHSIWPDREFYAELRMRSRKRPRQVVKGKRREWHPTVHQQLPTPAAKRSVEPRVSCLMATRDRHRFVPQAIQCFLDQEYRGRELIIVDDGTEAIEGLVPRDQRIQYVRLRSPRSIGAKRNLACELATGEFFICWDDDDWFGPLRIDYQVAPMLSGRSDATVLLADYMLDLTQKRFWRHVRVAGGLFNQGANWGTLAWSREWWAKGLRFPDISLAEDVGLQKSLVLRGARICRLPSEGTYIYVRHGKNTWQFPLDRAVAEGWRTVPPPQFLPEVALRFYGFPSPEQPCPQSSEERTALGEIATLT